MESCQMTTLIWNRDDTSFDRSGICNELSEILVIVDV